jgi:hypothetical protein
MSTGRATPATVLTGFRNLSSLVAILLVGCSTNEPTKPLRRTFPEKGAPPEAVLSGTRHSDGDMPNSKFTPTPLPK